eukprot:201281_1
MVRTITRTIIRFETTLVYKSQYISSLSRVRHYSSNSKKHSCIANKFPEIITDLSQQRHNARLDGALDRKQTLNRAKSAVPFDMRTDYKSHGKNYDIQVSLLKCKTAQDVLYTMQTNWQSVSHPSVYSIALKRCIKLRDWSKARQIMDLLVYSAVEPTIFEFTQFFNAMALSEMSPSLSDQYFERMRNDFGIVPDKFIFCILIKGCKKESQYKLAEKYWICMQKEYDIAPSSWLYTEMISTYARANKSNKAMTLFAQYYAKLKLERVECDVTTFHAYLTVFARNGDVKGMEQALQMIEEEQNIKCMSNKLFVTEVMSGYIRARMPHEAIRICEAFMEGKESTIERMEPMLELKCVALAHLMKEDSSNKLNLYGQIEGIMNELLQRNNPNYRFFHAKTLLYAAIIMFHDRDPQRMIQIFEDMVRKGYIGYLANDNVIDLHLFELLQVQFILRYIIANITHTHRDLILIVGTGKHNAYSNNKESVKQFVMNELLTFAPPLQCTITPHNKGQLRIDKTQLIPYMNDPNNYAKQKLMSTSSEDWYIWKDSRQ